MKRPLVASSILFASICIAIFVSTNIDRGSPIMTLGQLIDDPFVDEFYSNDPFDDLGDYTDSGASIPTEQTVPTVPEQNTLQPSDPAPIFYRNGIKVQVTMPSAELEVDPPSPSSDILESPTDLEPETQTGNTILLPEDTFPPEDTEPIVSGDIQPEENEFMHYASALEEWPIIPITVGAVAVLFALLAVLWLMKRKNVNSSIKEPISEDGIGPRNPQIASERLKQALSTLEADESEKEMHKDKMPEVITPADVIHEEATTPLPTTEEPPKELEP
ncbi:hypothetical protein KKF55_03645 [Patescibacteria group bacterium]|nr:hypothetical protein [Patescibacteria group bacterium]